MTFWGHEVVDDVLEPVNIVVKLFRSVPFQSGAVIGRRPITPKAILRFRGFVGIYNIRSFILSSDPRSIHIKLPFYPIFWPQITLHSTGFRELFKISSFLSRKRRGNLK